MKMMKRLNAMILLLVMAVVVGCGKDDPKPEKKCQLTKHIIVGTTANFITDYIYNSAGKLVRINYKDPFPDPNHIELIYNASGTLVETRNYGDGADKSLRSKQLFTYNANGLPDRVTDVQFGGINGVDTVGYHIYEYNQDKKLIKNSYFVTKHNAILGYNTFSYPAANQVIERKYSKRSTGPDQLGSTITRHYDDKKSPLLSLGYYSEEILVSTNNMVYESSTYPQGTTISYTYNAEGYPIDAIYDFHDSNSFHERWEYNCQ